MATNPPAIRSPLLAGTQALRAIHPIASGRPGSSAFCRSKPHLDFAQSSAPQLDCQILSFIHSSSFRRLGLSSDCRSLFDEQPPSPSVLGRVSDGALGHCYSSIPAINRVCDSARPCDIQCHRIATAEPGPALVYDDQRRKHRPRRHSRLDILKYAVAFLVDKCLPWASH